MPQQKCKACGKLIDSGLVICPHCQSDPNRPRQTVLTPDQVKHISKQVRKDLGLSVLFWLGILSLIFGIGFWQAYTKATKNLQNMLVKRIFTEFEQPHIRNTVKEVADDKAEELMLAEIKPEVKKFKKETQAGLKEIKDLINSAQSELSNLTVLIELEDAARLGSRKAFSRLKGLAVRSNSLGIMAQRRVSLIQKELLIFRSVPEAYMGLAITKDGKKQNADELSTSELFLYLTSRNMVKEHIPAMMAHIAKKPKNEVLLYAKPILESSDSLPACAAICGILFKMLGNRAPFLGFDAWLKVCQQELDKNN